MAMRYTPNRDRPDLCARAVAELGLEDPKARLLEGRWAVSGWQRGELVIYLAAHDGGWQAITNGADPDPIRSEYERLIENLEQGRLFP